LKTSYLVTYDIAAPDRLRAVFKVMKGAGEHLQYSVFRCDLSARGREQLISGLTEVIRPTEDQVLFVDLGPPDGRAATCIVALGRPYAPPGRAPIIV
jgi:CRISPR-associated protein Cas2